MLIRPVERSDLGSLVTVFRACWNISYRDLISAEVREAMDVATTMNLLTVSASPKPGRFTLVAIEDEILGFASFGNDVNDESRGHLFSLYVSPESAGKGVGSKLLTEVIAHLEQLDKQEIILWVFKKIPLQSGYTESLDLAKLAAKKTDERWQIPQIEMLRKAITQ